MFAHGETVTRLRGVEVTDPYSDEDTSLDWAFPLSLDIDGCAVAPRTSVEPVEDARTSVITGVVVYAPAGSDITSLDRLVVRGDTYEVDGDVGDWRSPFSGWLPGLEVNLKRVSG